MGKYTNTKKISKSQQENLFIRFAKCLGSLKNSTEAANLIKDLFSEAEVLMLARRLQIAELLSDGMTFQEIKRAMRVGDNTIAKVSAWLSMYGDGFRTVIKRTNERAVKTKSFDPLSFRNLKYKYPMRFWPQVLMEIVVKTMDAKQKQKLLRIAGQMKEKTKFTDELLRMLK